MYDPGPPARARAGGPGSKRGLAARASCTTGETVGPRQDHLPHARGDPRLGSEHLNGEDSALNRCHSNTLDTNKEEPGLIA